MNNPRLKLTSKGKLKDVRQRKKEIRKPKRKYNTKKTGQEELDKYVDMINDENYLNNAIYNLANKLAEELQ